MTDAGTDLRLQSTVAVLAIVLLGAATAARLTAKDASCSPATLAVMHPPTAEANRGVAAAIDGLGGAGTLRDLRRLGDATAPVGGDRLVSISWVWEVKHSARADQRAGAEVVLGTAHSVPASGRFEVLLLREAALTSTGPASWEALALHELGHLAGLGHGDQPGDVMYPSVEGMGASFTAHQSVVVGALASTLSCR